MKKILAGFLLAVASMAAQASDVPWQPLVGCYDMVSVDGTPVYSAIMNTCIRVANVSFFKKSEPQVFGLQFTVAYQTEPGSYNDFYWRSPDMFTDRGTIEVIAPGHWLFKFSGVVSEENIQVDYEVDFKLENDVLKVRFIKGYDPIAKLMGYDPVFSGEMVIKKKVQP